MGFAEPPGSPRMLVRSYRTVSPLPVRARSPSAVSSLWHFPAGHPDWALPSIVPCGVRTFLGPIVSVRGRPADSPPPDIEPLPRASRSWERAAVPLTTESVRSTTLSVAAYLTQQRAELGQEHMAETLSARVARLEAEVQELREILDKLSIWVTGGRASANRNG